MQWLNNIRQIGKATHTCRMWYHVLRVVMPHKTTTLSLEEAEHIMEQRYADKGSTCVKTNTIAAHPEYDLEIIVPVYNAADYLEACIESINGQIMKHINLSSKKTSAVSSIALGGIGTLLMIIFLGCS